MVNIAQPNINTGTAGNKKRGMGITLLTITLSNSKSSKIKTRHAEILNTSASKVCDTQHNLFLL
jgi:hypothetical protein